VAVLDGRFFVSGGFTEDGVTDSVEGYDPATEEWHDLPPLSAARCEHGMVAVQKHLLVAGGSNEDGEELASVEIFDFEAQAWSALAPMLSPTSPVQLVQLQNPDEVYALGPVLDFPAGEGAAGSLDLEEDASPVAKDEVLDVFTVSSRTWREARVPLRTRAAYTGSAAAVV